jgi:hypothetical protein
MTLFGAELSELHPPSSSEKLRYRRGRDLNETTKTPRDRIRSLNS